MAAINTLNSTTWRKLSEDSSSSCVHLVNKKLHLSFPAFYAKDVKQSVMSVIERRLIKYEPELGGILASCGKVAVVGPKADIMFNLPEIHVDVEGEFFIFNPSVGSKLIGAINKKSPGHLGCLVHGLFNISLPKPFSMPVQSWLGTQANLHDEVVLTVTRADFQSQVPYIEGSIVEIKHIEENTACERERTCSDSGVSIGSDEPASAKKTKKTGSRLSISKQAANLSKTLDETLKEESLQKTLEEPAATASAKKRKRDRLEANVVPAIAETPTKKLKTNNEVPKEDANDDDLCDLTSNLFAVASKKIMNDMNSDKKKKPKKRDSQVANTSVNSTIVEKAEDDAGSLSSSSSKLGKKKKVKSSADDVDQEDIIKELMSSVLKSTPIKGTPSVKASKKRLSMTQVNEDVEMTAWTPVSTASNKRVSQIRAEFVSPPKSTPVKTDLNVSSSKTPKIKKETPNKKAKDSLNESLINSILKSAKKKQ